MSEINKVVKDGVTTYQDCNGNEVDRDTLKRSFVERGTRILVEIATLKEDFSALKDEAKEAGFDKKEINVLIKHNFKNEIEFEIEELNGIQKELDRLFDGDDSED